MTREKAINLVKQVFPCLNVDEKIREGFKTLISELAESEDERTRKELVEYHKQQFEKNRDQEVGLFHKDAITYLEKQKPAESISQLTVQGKGVYKICPYCKERMIRDDSKVYTSIPPQYGYNCPKCGAMEFDTVIYDNPEMEEPKQECNDNERIRKDIIALIKFGLNDGSAVSPGSYTTKEEALDWLEKQKESLRDFIDDFPYSDEQKEPHFTKRNALFDKCVENCDPEVMKKVSDEIDKMLQKEQKYYWKPTETDVALFNKAVTTNKTLTPTERAQLDIIRSKFGCCRATNCSGIVQKEQKPFNVCEQCKCPDYNEQKPTECIDFDNEFENQVSHLIASVLNGEHEYNESFVKYAAQSLLEYAKNEIKPDEWDKREKLFTKALQTANARIGQLFEENQKLKEQKPTEIDEYKIIKKHITEDSLSSEVNKRLKECGWYVTDTESSEWSEEDEKDIAHIIRVLDDCYAYGKHDLSKTDHENLVGTLKSIHPQLKSEWSEEDEGELQNAIDALEFLGKKGTYKSESGYDAALKAASWLKLFRLQPKSEWSEEDSDNLERVDNYLWMLDDYVGDDCAMPQGKTDKIRGNIQRILSPWLKSLPERFNLEPKQEWSEKDEKMFSRCIKSIESSKQFASSSVEEKDKEIAWLKALSLSLKKRNEDVAKLCSNEWSEEDKRKLDGIIQWLREYQKEFNPKYDSLSIESIESLINWLKSLRSSWKPTKEQMDALRDVIETVPMTCRQQVPLESLYSDLNKNF